MPRRRRHAALPNLIIIGGLKCGTTSIHHYLGLHPEIQMSKPKELNFFVEELNWDLGLDWYASRFDDRFKVRGESSPALHEPAPLRRASPSGSTSTAPTRACSTWCATRSSGSSRTGCHATGAGYETGDDGRGPLPRPTPPT